MSDLPTIEEALDEVGLELPRSRKLECPKHEDKTPSIHVYEDSWYCYSCGLSGDGIGLVALYTNQDVRRLLAQRGGERPRRMATRGLSKTDVARSVQTDRRALEHWWFDEISKAYAGSHQWALERAIDLWSQVFQDLDEKILAKGAWLDEDKPAPFEAEEMIRQLRTRLEGVLPLEQAEGQRTENRK